MNKTNTFLIDGGVALGLALALFVVIGLDKIISVAAPSSSSSGVKIEEEPEIKVAESSAAKPLRIAVTPTQVDTKDGSKWDDMTKLLDKLGAGYKYTVYPVNELSSANRLADYDVLFYTCGPGGTDTPTTQALRQWVGSGGTLYASDWRYDSVALAFPDYNVRALEGEGAHQHVQAQILDPALRDLLGESSIDLRFNLSRWKPAAFGGDHVKVLMKGEYQKDKGAGMAVAPLLVKFQFKKGTVIFTSFHNEAQNSEMEIKLLKYLVFSAVTAKTETQVAQTMLKGGFSPQKSNLLSASPDNPSVTKTYRNKKAGNLRFVLGFENRGAKLKLSVVSPGGKKHEKTGSSTITMDFSNAAAGDWEYTVTAEYVPFPDFPFTLTVGESVGKKE